ncbi:hypothetical protein LRH25_11415 [Ideonella azotifigens]|uniref:WG repeat-containing protein n=1 Tax=Ideonella azotifigens TaxID=513160 RepID=A0ABP3V0F4_9BURK|nr:hypothetical protein [Ideonella azotifigens]MCD2340950.1 hypothetical protein [Ideonella azotifigens]
MRFVIHRFSVAAVALAAALVPRLAAAETYRLQLLQNPSGASDAVTSTLDQQGVVTGRAWTGTRWVPVLWTQGVPQVLPLPDGHTVDTVRRSEQNGYTVSAQGDRGFSMVWRPDGSSVQLSSWNGGDENCACQGFDVDPQGRVMGRIPKDGLEQAAVWTDPTLPPTLLPTDVAVAESAVYRTSANGWMSGWRQWPETGGIKMLVWKDGLLVPTPELDALGYPSINAINANGTAVGGYLDPSRGSLAMLWKPGQVLPLPALAHTVCTATALNNLDVAVGNCTGIGVIWRNGQVTSLTKLLDTKARAAGWMISYPTAINDSGAIVVQAQSRNDPQNRVFQAVLKPTAARASRP